MKKKIKLVAFDADDTLWFNEPHYRTAENELEKILSKYIQVKSMGDSIYSVESNNIHLYGYGAKGFTLSMIETAILFTEKKITSTDILEIIQLGKKLMDYEIKLLPDTIKVLQEFSKKTQMILITKGDLKDQERKIFKSKLAKFFSAIEIISEKDNDTYLRVLNKYDTVPGEFLMIGNSIRSDILPVLNIGGNAVHLTGQSSWVHELKVKQSKNVDYFEINELKELISIIENDFQLINKTDLNLNLLTKK